MDQRLIRLVVILFAVSIAATVIIGALLGTTIGLGIDFLILGPERFTDLIVSIGLVLVGIGVAFFRPLPGAWSWVAAFAAFMVAVMVFTEMI